MQPRVTLRARGSYGALSFFDYAAAGPYVDVVMNETLPAGTPDAHLAYKASGAVSLLLRQGRAALTVEANLSGRRLHFDAQVPRRPRCVSRARAAADNAE
jgi:hypothetical protein